MKDTIVMYTGWSIANQKGDDIPLWERNFTQGCIPKIYKGNDFFNAGSHVCKKCGWDIAYCEPHWETSLMSYGYSTGRWNNRHYHLHCYKKDTTEYSVYPVCRHEDGTDEDSIKTGADPRVLKHSICHITTKDYIWKMKEVIEVGHD
jgi:hypothetical protein